MALNFQVSTQIRVYFFSYILSTDNIIPEFGQLSDWLLGSSEDRSCF